jgi:regulator of protease activity HflC (stomatin/prohibitin superfamily)
MKANWTKWMVGIITIIVIAIVVLTLTHHFRPSIKMIPEIILNNWGYAITIVVVSIILSVSFWWFLGTLISFLGEKGIFFTTIKDGQIKVVRRGGIVVRFIGKIKNHELNEITGEINESVGFEQPIGYWGKKLGVCWIGVYPWNTIYHYKFKWNKWSRLPGKTEYEIIPRDEIVDSVYFRAPYALILKDLESSDRLSLTVEVLFTFKMKNVRTALFLTNDWLANASAEGTAAIRDFFGAREYNGLVTMQNEIKSKGEIVAGEVSEFVTAIKTLNDDGFGNDSLPKKFGPLIDDVSLLSIEIGEPKGELAKATHEKYVAERKAEKTLTDATAEAGRIIKEATAEAEKIKLVGKETADAIALTHTALGVDGNQIGLIKLSEAIGKANTQTVVLGNTASPIVGLKT